MKSWRDEERTRVDDHPLLQQIFGALTRLPGLVLLILLLAASKAAIAHSRECLDPRIVELARDADVPIHDGQYTPEELPGHRGWGHSSWVQAMEVSGQSRVKRLVVTHHDPDHDDAFLLEVEEQCRSRFPDMVLAREQMEIVT